MNTEQRLSAILSRVHYRDWHIALRLDGERFYLQVQFESPCIVNGAPMRQHGRKWMLSPHMSTSEVVATAFKACLAAEEHECREAFRYRGQPVFGPHVDVEWMAAQMEARSVTDVRPERSERNISHERD